MNELVKRLSALLAVKSIISLMLTTVICYMAVKGGMPSEVVAGFYGSVMTYFFVKATQAENKETGT